MYVHRSNRAEELVRVLADVVGTPAGDPFARECVVVQGRGREGWLALELARRYGVWANPDFPFPRRLVLRAMDAVLGPPGPVLARFTVEEHPHVTTVRTHSDSAHR